MIWAWIRAPFKMPASTIMSDDKPVPTAGPGADTTTPPTPPETLGKGPEQKPGEIGGPKGPEPTRYGDWEVKGRCSDF